MKCRNKYCRGVVTESGHSPFCGKCQYRQFKARHPLKNSYFLLKKRARHRGKEFSLTFEQYEQFAKSTGYAKLKGKTKYSLSIDRIDPNRGYHADNIRAITLSLNSKLRWANLPTYLKEEMIAAERGEI